MADNKSKRGGGDRKRIAASQGYEVSYFARKHDLTSEQARQIIKRVGNDRKKLNVEAENMATKTVGGRGGNRGTATNANGGNRDRRALSMAKGNPLALAAAVVSAFAAGVLLWSRRNEISDQIGKLADDMRRPWQETEVSGNFAAKDTSGGASNAAGATRGSSGSRTQVEIA